MLRRFSKKGKSPGSASSSNDNEIKAQKKLLGKFLEFITSSIWSIPITSFIETQSVVFDRQQMETQVYYEIHKEYAVLIDTLIECFCEDVSTTSSKLVDAIKLFDQNDISEKYKVALEPLLAAQNFNVFVPMMMRKNVELQLQALQMIEFMCGLIPNVLQLEDGETLRHMKKLSPEETERYVLISVLRHSKDEYDSQQKGRGSELEDVARNSRMQREQLEHNIRQEELLLMKASMEYVQQISDLRKSNNSSSTQTDSVAAAMASHFTVAPDDLLLVEQKPNSSGMTSSEEAMGSASSATSGTTKNRPSSAKPFRKYSKAGLEDLVGAFQQNEQSEPKIESNEPKNVLSRPSSRKMSRDGALGAQNEPKPNPDEPKEVLKEPRPSTRKMSRDAAPGALGAQNEPKTDSNEPKEVLKEPRPSTRKMSRDGAPNESQDAQKEPSRPSSRAKSSQMSREPRKSTPHEPRAKTPFSNDRPSTRRSSVDKLAPKRNDSVPRERRASLNRSKDVEKPPKPVGPLRSNKIDNEPIMGRAQSPGVEHGPRRKNLNDVNSQLVDPNRLNSSDVRSRAQYLREQRDKLLQLKNEERIKQMNDIQKSSSIERPRTAHAARGVLDKKEAETIRKEISEKLKAEILTLHN